MTNFTPQQIEEFLQEFFDVVGTRQYIGARYVPIFGRRDEDTIAWDNSAPYEPLTIVTYQGNSYTSRQYVPADVEITDTDYWVMTGDFNAQVEQYRNEVLTLVNTTFPAFKAEVEHDFDELSDSLQQDVDTFIEDGTDRIDEALGQLETFANSAAKKMDTARLLSYGYSAHQGLYSAYVPQSVWSYEMCGRLGFKVVECDTQLTSDGYIVCWHDNDIHTIIGVADTYNITEHTLAEIRSYDIVSGTNVSLGPSRPLATLEEVVEVCNRYGMALIMDRKSAPARTALEAARQYGLKQGFVCSTETTELRELYMAGDCEYPLMYIAQAISTTIIDTLAEIGVCCTFNLYSNLTAELVSYAHQKGLYVGAWNTDNYSLITSMREIGCDFISLNSIVDELPSGTVTWREYSYDYVDGWPVFSEAHKHLMEHCHDAMFHMVNPTALGYTLNHRMRPDFSGVTTYTGYTKVFEADCWDVVSVNVPAGFRAAVIVLDDARYQVNTFNNANARDMGWMYEGHHDIVVAPRMSLYNVTDFVNTRCTVFVLFSSTTLSVVESFAFYVEENNLVSLTKARQQPLMVWNTIKSTTQAGVLSGATLYSRYAILDNYSAGARYTVNLNGFEEGKLPSRLGIQIFGANGQKLSDSSWLTTSSTWLTYDSESGKYYLDIPTVANAQLVAFVFDIAYVNITPIYADVIHSVLPDVTPLAQTVGV